MSTDFAESFRQLEEATQLRETMRVETPTVHGVLPVKVHPVASIFPMGSADEFAGLKADIAEHGVRECIVFQGGVLIDGRNRMAAMIALGIDWKCYAGELEPDTDAVAYIVSHNIHRRHLDASQRALIAAEIRDTFDEQGRQRRNAKLKQGGESPVVANSPQRGNKRSRDAAGEMLNVSGRSVDRATKVLESGDDKLISDVKAGDVSISAAARQLKDDQAKAAKLSKRIIEAEAEPAAPKSSGPTQWDALLKRHASTMKLFDQIVAERRNNELSDKITGLYEQIETLISKYRQSVRNGGSR